MLISVRFVPELHGLRGMAAVSVLLFHWVQAFPGLGNWLARYPVPGYPWANMSLPFALGFEGVTLFFVLSGYLLTSHLQSAALTARTVGTFYLRRVLRIYPAVWLQMAGLLVLGWLFPTVWAGLPWPEVLLNALLWVNLPPTFTPLLNSVWWTLPVELLFYLILPLLLWVQRRVGLGGLVILMLVVTLGWRSFVMNRYGGQDLSAHLAVLDALPGVLTSFGAGLVAACLQQRIQPQQGRWLLGVSVAGCMAVQMLLITHIATYWHGGWLLLGWNTLLAMSMAGLVLAACRGEKTGFQRTLAAPWMVWLGELSFGIYLWHFPVILGLRAWWPQAIASAMPSLAALGVLLALTLALAAASYALVEKRMMRLGR